MSWRATVVFEEGGVVRSSMVVSSSPGAPKAAGDATEPPGPPKAGDAAAAEPEAGPVSYTHLTLPTILLV